MIPLLTISLLTIKSFSFVTQETKVDEFFGKKIGVSSESCSGFFLSKSELGNNYCDSHIHNSFTNFTLH